MKRRTLTTASLNAEIRRALLHSVRIEASKTPFTLSGRGHEPRVTVDRQLAAILRSVKLPCVIISGFGANIHYPKRIFDTAIARLVAELGKSPISFYNDKAYRNDEFS